jgi:hypothetical protein
LHLISSDFKFLIVFVDALAGYTEIMGITKVTSATKTIAKATSLRMRVFT